FFNDTATTEIYTLSLHDALPICRREVQTLSRDLSAPEPHHQHTVQTQAVLRSEEHTSELQSHSDLGCRLPLAKKYWRPSGTRPAEPCSTSTGSRQMGTAY